ncbi:ABC transporter permease [Oceanidesulfovibrio indonesiensis]|uniref:ABC transporter permease n=1 Tax=Oceanidesulfovibrio indonesiensis TaxID=54767 RepID=A0A7M3MAT5_9BACT|nr:ABC transporter permease [Oceanidesulfovibrio indonesiensis]TVM15019.1 ABC transporter permease [Oceanidesulfovibrio indonesiensis]
MSETPKISRVGLVGVALGLGGLLLADFVVLRPNRLAPGEAVSVFQAIEAWRWFMLVAGFLLLGLCCLRVDSVRKSVAVQVATMLGVALPPVLCLGLMAGLGYAATSNLDAANPFLRVSVGSAFWLAVLGLFVAFTDFYQRLARNAHLWALLVRLGLLVGFLGGVALILQYGGLGNLSLAKEYAGRSHRFFVEMRAHLAITGLAVGSAAVIGLPLGVLMHRWRRIRNTSLSVLNIVQTIPSLALFGLLIAPLAWLSAQAPGLREFGVRGIGWLPAVIALGLYALLPIVRNTYAGFERLETAVVEAGRGMGMDRMQLFFKVELPVASPIILNGLRIAGVQIMGNTAVAALIGAGGFGVFIFQGLGQSAIDLIMLGAVPTIVLAVALDLVFQVLTRAVTPRGLE